MKDRVHFYSANDMSVGFYLDRLESVLNSYEENKTYSDLNDVIELWHCKKIIACGFREIWDETKQNRYKEIAKKLPSDIIRYFQTIEANSFLSKFGTLDYEYQQTIFDIFDKIVKTFLTENILNQILTNHPHLIRSVLNSSNTVNRFSKLIREYLKSNSTTAAELLLNQYVEFHDNEDYKEMYFPKSFSLDDREQCISDYLGNDNVNLNYVRLALACKDSKDLRLTPKTRLKAKRTHEKLNSALCDKDSATSLPIKIGTTVEGPTYRFEKPIETVNENTDDGVSLITHISKEYLMQCSDTDIIYNFALFFEWFNIHGYSKLVSNPNQLSIFEKISMHAKNSYPIGLNFQIFNNLAKLQITACNEVLKEGGRSLELVLKGFYETNLKENYGYPAPIITIPSPDSDYVTKLRTLIPEMDAIVKHYDTFVENGEIDLELIAISKPLPVTNGRSLLKIRNVYTTSNKSCEIYHICYCLFSDQTLLSYVDPYKDLHYSRLYDLMIHEQVNYSMYEEHQKPSIDYLLDKGIILLDGDKNLKFANNNQISIFFNIWKYKVISYWNSPATIRNEINIMLAKGWLESDNYLLSRQEQDWFSYYLNNAKFTNGPTIRNIFEHGANTAIKEPELMMMYNTVLMLLLTLLYKIDLDLRLASMAKVLNSK